jgi:hypothetical protein
MFLKWLYLNSAAVCAPPGEGTGPNEGDTEGHEEIQGEDEGQEGGEADAVEGQEDAPVDDEEGHEGQVDDEPARRPSRAQTRIQTLTRTATEAKDKAEKLERELADFRAEQRQRQQQATQESPQDRAARRALMDPLDVMREDLKESEARTANVLHQQALQTQETNDRTTYNAILREAPHLKKYDGEVERIRKEQLAEGRFVPREVLLDLAIGRAARASAVKNAPRAKAQAAARVAGQKVNPARASGDTATARGRQGDSPEKRLENVPI